MDLALHMASFILISLPTDFKHQIARVGFNKFVFGLQSII